MVVRKKRTRLDSLIKVEPRAALANELESIPRQLETNAGIAGFLLSAEFHGLGADYDRDLPGFLEAVTLDGVNAVARRLLDPSKAVVVVAGPWQMTEESAAAALPLPDASAATLVARVNSPR